MRAVIQRVTEASVEVENKIVSSIGRGLVVLLGVGTSDKEGIHEKLADKIVNLRIFDDKFGKMNFSLLDIKGDLLLVSQFTLFSEIKRGRRPSFTEAADSKNALKLFNEFSDYIETYNINVARGVFGEDMKVSLCNSGPVTIVIDENTDL